MRIAGCGHYLEAGPMFPFRRARIVATSDRPAIDQWLSFLFAMELVFSFSLLE
jgi:hypothetical protein